MILYRGEDDFRLSPTRIFCGFQNEQINVVFSSSPPTSPPRRNMVDGQRQKINNKRKKRRKYIINRPDGIILLFSFLLGFAHNKRQIVLIFFPPTRQSLKPVPYTTL